MSTSGYNYPACRQPFATTILVLALLLTATPGFTAGVAAPAAGVNSVTLTWTAPGDDGSSGRAAQYDIRYALSPITDAGWASASPVTGEPVPAVAGAAETFTVTGLNPATTYYFAIKVADEALNWSPLSNVASATTATASDNLPPATVTGLSTGSPARTSLTLVWLAPGDDGTTGTAQQYDIRYAARPIQNSPSWNTATPVIGEPSPSPAGSPETLTVTGLTEGTTYFFALKTADEAGNWSGLSNSPSGTTASDETPPAAVVDLRAVAGAADSTIDVTWTAAGDDGLVGTAAACELRYSTNPITDANWSQATLCPAVITPLASGLEQRITLTGLQPGALYYVAVKTFDDAANSSPLSNVDTAVAKYSFSTGIDDDDLLPSGFALCQNYPNPFNPTTAIRFTLPTAGQTELIIYNTSGQEVTRLVDTRLPAGEHHVSWDGRDRAGRPVATGVYYYRLANDDRRETRKMVLLK